MNGIECTKRLREMGYENLIFGLTGNTLQAELDAFRNEGANLVLTKPLQIGQLDLLLRYINRKGLKSSDFNINEETRHLSSRGTVSPSQGYRHFASTKALKMV